MFHSLDKIHTNNLLGDIPVGAAFFVYPTCLKLFDALILPPHHSAHSDCLFSMFESGVTSTMAISQMAVILLSSDSAVTLLLMLAICLNVFAFIALLSSASRHY